MCDLYTFTVDAFVWLRGHLSKTILFRLLIFNILREGFREDMGLLLQMNSLASLESEKDQATTIMSFSRFGRLLDNSLLHIRQALRAGEDLDSNVFTLLIDETKSLYTYIKAHVNV